MQNNKIEYKEGSVFVVPLIDLGYGVGLITRFDDSIILGYFLSYRFNTIPKIDQVSNLFYNYNNIIMIKFFGSRGIEKKSWKIIGELENWRRENWNVPAFWKKDSLRNIFFKIYYDDNLHYIKQEIVTDINELEKLPKDGVAGYGFVEKRLARLLTSLYI